MADRYDNASTPEERIAVVVVDYAKRHSGRNAFPPDYPDVAAALKFAVRIELLQARLEEARLAKQSWRSGQLEQEIEDTRKANGEQD